MRQGCRIPHRKPGKVWQLCLKISWEFNVSFYAETPEESSWKCGVHLSSECLHLTMIPQLRYHQGSQMGMGLSAGKLDDVMEQKETCLYPHITKLRAHKKRINFARILTGVFLNVSFWNFPGDTSSYLDNRFKWDSSALLLCIHKIPCTRCSVNYQTVNWGKQDDKAER